MTTSSLKAQDIILVDKKGRRFYALVTEVVRVRGAKEFRIRPIAGAVTYRACTAREIAGIWHANADTRSRFLP